MIDGAKFGLCMKHFERIRKYAHYTIIISGNTDGQKRLGKDSKFLSKAH